MNRLLRVPAALAIALAFFSSLLLDSPVPGAQHAAANAQGSDYWIGCTLKLLDLERHRLEVIVGVGHALRIVKMDLSASCRASARGQRIPLQAIHPGDIVRVHYESPPGAAAALARGTATRIDLVLAASDRRRP